MTRDQEISIVKGVLDTVSLSTLLGWMGGVLPAVATILTVLWTVLRIWETRTVQTWWTGESPPRPPSELFIPTDLEDDAYDDD